MYHSISFGDGSVEWDSTTNSWNLVSGLVNTWDDWYLIPTKRPDIALPGVSTSFIDIPGRDGSIDSTELITNHPVYSDRSGSFEFYVMNDKKNDKGSFNGTWVDLRNQIVRTLHGRRKYMVLESEPNYYYDGRFTVDGWNSESDYSHINISYRLRPFKRHLVNLLYDEGELNDIYVHDSSIERNIKTNPSGLSLIVKLTAGSGCVLTYSGGTRTLTPSTPEADFGTAWVASTLRATGTGVVSLAFGGEVL